PGRPGPALRCIRRHRGPAVDAGGRRPALGNRHQQAGVPGHSADPDARLAGALRRAGRWRHAAGAQAGPGALAACRASPGHRAGALRLCRRRRARHRRRARRRDAVGGGLVGIPAQQRRSVCLARGRTGRGPATAVRGRGMADPDVTGAAAPADAREADAAALEAFLDKWRARWPEWAIAEVFVPAAERGRALAWAALLQELRDAAWGGEDPRPGLAKLGWWQEELQGWGRGVRRHPLGIVLQRVPAPWAGLAAALDSLPASRERPGDVEEAFAGVAPFARAAAGVEQALFGVADEPDPPQPDQAEDALMAAWLLQSRFLHGNDAHVPLELLAAA